eukprot:jgi/Psemu1/52261/gm1.52261_g
MSEEAPEPTSLVVPVTLETRATTTPDRTTSSTFEGVLERLANRHLLADWGDKDTYTMITSDERELTIKGLVDVHTFKQQLGNTLLQVSSIVYKFGDGYSFLIDSLAVYQVQHMDAKKRQLPDEPPEPDNPTMSIGLINCKFPNMLMGLHNPMSDASPVGITTKAVYNHIEGRIDTTKVLQESYLDPAGAPKPHGQRQ